MVKVKSIHCLLQ